MDSVQRIPEGFTAAQHPGVTMQRRGSVSQLCALITIILHMVVVAGSQTVNENDGHANTEGFRGLEGNAFFALRSCHQVLSGDSGEFFSPDYLCSSPALWCNWTIQAPRGKRVQLYLEDLTPEYTCHLKMDQIHLDESPVAAGGTQILERCWQRASYTSVSDTVHVVQLIGPNPNPPHRGFYGQYQAFGPLVSPPAPTVGDPESDTAAVKGDLLEEEVEVEEEEEEKEEEMEAEEVTQAPDQEDLLEVALPVEHIDDALVEPVEVIHVTHSWANELPTTGIWEKNSGEVRKTRDGAENQAAAAEEGVLDQIPAEEYAPLPLAEGEGSAQPSAHTFTTQNLPTEGVAPLFTTSATVGQHETLQTAGADPTVAETVTRPGSKDDGDVALMEMPYVDGGGTFQAGAAELDTSLDNKIQQNSTRRPKPPHRTKGNSLPVHTIRDPAEPPHLPGGVLLEVTIEVAVDHSHRESWAYIRSAFMTEVEKMIEKHLENLHLKSISAKRAKRLTAGALLIVWVQFGPGQEGGLMPSVLQSTLERLKGESLKPHGINSHGTISSISVEDIDECETRLVMCDVNAECVNEFGSYSCHCRHGYSPGLGGAMCVGPEGEDCSRTPFPTILYVVCVLLGFLIALLLVVLGAFYRRYHRGAFLPHCHSGSTRSFTATASDGNNNSETGLNGGADTCTSRPLPPPPPLRLPREPCATLDLPLLKFAPLAPSGGFEDKLQRQKDQL